MLNTLSMETKMNYFAIGYYVTMLGFVLELVGAVGL